MVTLIGAVVSIWNDIVLFAVVGQLKLRLWWNDGQPYDESHSWDWR